MCVDLRFIQRGGDTRDEVMMKENSIRLRRLRRDLLADRAVPRSYDGGSAIATFKQLF
jgi:hypothetical protein